MAETTIKAGQAISDGSTLHKKPTRKGEQEMAIPQKPAIEDELKRLELKSKKADLKNKRWELLFKLAGLATITFGIFWPLYQYKRPWRRREKIVKNAKYVKMSRREKRRKRRYV